MKSKATTSVPLPVRSLLKKLGEDISDARKRRRISTATMAERVRISRPTLLRLERGDAKVSLGIFATVLFVLGLHNRLADLADAAHDRMGLDLQSETLPKRIYGSRKRRLVVETTHEPRNRSNESSREYVKSGTTLAKRPRGRRSFSSREPLFHPTV